MRFKNVIFHLVHHSGVTYPVPSNITYWWNFGVLALFCLVVQVISGIFLAMHYVAHADIAFISVEHIMRDINYGWLLRYIHANGASMFFLVVYVHLFRNLYYGSYNYQRRILWCTGVIILLIMILTAFMGYVLPWGQMSFWAATVITNLVSAIPYIGVDILSWLWGGFAVDNATLNRFFSFHYLLPFILIGLVACHIIYLHEFGSNNALGIICNHDKIPFTPYFTIKDIFGLVVFFIFFAIFIFFAPVYLGHPDNFLPANPLVTPNHIVPEWYFLPFYAILRSVPDKLIGVLLLLASILVLLIFPYSINSNIASGYFRPIYQFFFWFFVFNCILLGWIGGKAIEDPYYILGQIFTSYYFLYFLILLPLLSIVNNKFDLYRDREYFTAELIDVQLKKNTQCMILKQNKFIEANKIQFDGQLIEDTNQVNIVNICTLYFNKTKVLALKHNHLRLLPRSFYKYENIRNFLLTFVFFNTYNQSALLFSDGDRIPILITFFVLFGLYSYFFTKKDNKISQTEIIVQLGDNSVRPLGEISYLNLLTNKLWYSWVSILRNILRWISSLMLVEKTKQQYVSVTLDMQKRLAAKFNLYMHHKFMFIIFFLIRMFDTSSALIIYFINMVYVVIIKVESMGNRLLACEINFR